MTVALKRYLVALPVPTLDRDGRRLADDRVRTCTERVQHGLTKIFGGATVLAAPGSSAASAGATEPGQALVIAACDDRDAFLRRRGEVHALAESVKADLDQQAALVLGFASDSFIVEDRA